MDERILIIVTIVLSLGYCEAIKDCFGNELTELVDLKELPQRLGEIDERCSNENNDILQLSECIFKETAKLLAECKDKEHVWYQRRKYKIRDLLELTQSNIESSHCSSAYFGKYSGMCQAMKSIDDILYVYCVEGESRLSGRCGELYGDLISGKPYYKQLLDYSVEYSAKNPKPNGDSMELFISELSQQDSESEAKKKFVLGCCELIAALEATHMYLYRHTVMAQGFIKENEADLLDRCRHLQEHTFAVPIQGVSCWHSSGRPLTIDEINATN